MKQLTLRRCQTALLAPGIVSESWLSSQAVNLKSVGIACILRDEGDMKPGGPYSAEYTWRAPLEAFFEQPGNRCHPGRK